MEPAPCSPLLQLSKDYRFRACAMLFALRKDNEMDYLQAFLIGGLFCVIGQILIDKTKLTPARILVGYVVAGVILDAMNFATPSAGLAGLAGVYPAVSRIDGSI